MSREKITKSDCEIGTDNAKNIREKQQKSWDSRTSLRAESLTPRPTHTKHFQFKAIEIEVDELLREIPRAVFHSTWRGNDRATNPSQGQFYKPGQKQGLKDFCAVCSFLGAGDIGDKNRFFLLTWSWCILISFLISVSNFSLFLYHRMYFWIDWESVT